MNKITILLFITLSFSFISNSQTTYKLKTYSDRYCISEDLNFIANGIRRNNAYSVLVINIKNNSIVYDGLRLQLIQKLKFIDNSRLLVIGLEKIIVWNFKTGAIEKSLEISPFWNKLNTPNINAIDYLSNLKIPQRKIKGNIDSLDIKFQNCILVGGDNQKISLFNLNDGNEILSFDNISRVNSLRFLRRQEYIVAGDNKGFIKVWSANNRIVKKQIELKIHDMGIKKIRSSPNDSTLAVLGYNGKVKIIDTNTWSVKNTFYANDIFDFLNDNVVFGFERHKDKSLMYSIAQEKLLSSDKIVEKKSSYLGYFEGGDIIANLSPDKNKIIFLRQPRVLGSIIDIENSQVLIWDVEDFFQKMLNSNNQSQIDGSATYDLFFEFQPWILPVIIGYSKEKGFIFKFGNKAKIPTPLGDLSFGYEMLSEEDLKKVTLGENDLILKIINRETGKSQAYKIKGGKKLKLTMEVNGEIEILATNSQIEIEIESGETKELTFSSVK